MKDKFKVGDKVVCINANDGSGMNLVVGNTYEVSIVDEDYMRDGRYLIGIYPNSSTHAMASRFKLEELIDWTKPVETISGLSVEVISASGRGNYPVLVYIADDTMSITYTLSGKQFIGDHENSFNLQNVKPKPIEIIRYFNMYKDGIANPGYKSREEANKGSDLEGRIGCKRVVFTEGEFDD